MLQNMKEILRGTATLDNQKKYAVIGWGMVGVHLFFAISFTALSLAFLSIYNYLVVVYYVVFSTLLVKKKNYKVMFIASYVEIIFHSSMASLLLGWEWGFMLYTIVLVPVAFYFMHTMPDFNDSISMPGIISVVVIVCYFMVSILSDIFSPIIDAHASQFFIKFVYYYNNLLATLLLLIFSVLFSLEIRYMKRLLQKENQNLKEEAEYDPLTKLRNRRNMEVHMNNALKRGQNTGEAFCLVMIDIDNFKKFNDTYGHDCGDKVLVSIGQIITQNVRNMDYVSRWGGEEMLLLIKDKKEAVYQISERIRLEISKHVIMYGDNEISVTVTMGISQYEDGKDLKSMLLEADNNLYKGKSEGKNRVVV